MNLIASPYQQEFKPKNTPQPMDFIKQIEAQVMADPYVIAHHKRFVIFIEVRLLELKTKGYVPMDTQLRFSFSAIDVLYTDYNSLDYQLAITNYIAAVFLAKLHTLHPPEKVAEILKTLSDKL